MQLLTPILTFFERKHYLDFPFGQYAFRRLQRTSLTNLLPFTQKLEQEQHCNYLP